MGSMSDADRFRALGAAQTFIAKETTAADLAAARIFPARKIFSMSGSIRASAMLRWSNETHV
jgi:hypothetical protein